jgi:dihydroflavonol-4-reductase
LKALVTGATGFIGSHLVEALVAGEWSVRCLVRGNAGVRLRESPVERCSGDCGDPMSLKKAVQGVDVIFHLAGAIKALDTQAYFDVNAVGTDNLLRACVEFNPAVKAFVYVSSQAAAGPSGRAAKTEADRSAPISPYGKSKRRAEELVLDQSAKIPVVILRPVLVYGPGDRNLLPLFRLISSWGIQPRTMGDQRLSLLYIEDLVRGLLLASEREEARGEIFFLSDGQDYGWKEIGHAAALAVGRRARALPVPKSFIWASAVMGEMVAAIRRKPALLDCGRAKDMVQSSWVCDIGKSRGLLGFEPRVTLDEGARLTFLWYKEARWL